MARNRKIEENRLNINANDEGKAEGENKAPEGPTQVKIGKYTVDKGIPMPVNAGRKGRAEKYPWAALNIGDSFFMPQVRSGNMVSQKNTHYKDQRHFICGADTVEGVEGLRVWRDK